MNPYATAPRNNIGQTVRVCTTGEIGTVTIDLRRLNTRPPQSHVLLYVRWRDRFLGAWLYPADLDVVATVGLPR